LSLARRDIRAGLLITRKPRAVLHYVEQRNSAEMKGSATYTRPRRGTWYARRGTKYRRKFLKRYVLIELKKSLYATVKKYPTLWIVSMNTDDDHVHLQIEISPNVCVSDAVDPPMDYGALSDL
jgi:Transposase IS200 like